MRAASQTSLVIVLLFLAGCGRPESGTSNGDGGSSCVRCVDMDQTVRDGSNGDPDDATPANNGVVDTGEPGDDLGAPGEDAADESDACSVACTPATDWPIQQVRAGRHHTCALMDDGATYCWGQGAFRALGGDYNFQGTPRLIEAFGDALAIGAGTKFGCAIRPGGEVWCWGESDHAQVGGNQTIPCGDCTPIPACATSICVPTPQPMAGLEAGIVELGLGRAHGCALRDDGRVLCWGDNASGQVGVDAVMGDAVAPELVAEVTGATQITAGIDHSCALVGSPGTVMCWGRNDRAQVGNGEVSDAVRVPASVAALSDAVEIVGGGSHTCARRADGTIVCWGYNYLGALGNGSTRPTRATSIQNVVGIDDAVALAAGQYFTCALRSTGAVSCWGDNRHGQLGDGTAAGENCADRPCRTTPVDVLVVDDVATITGGELHACAASRSGTLWCWGYNLGGQLGTGGVDSDPTPVPVEVQGLPD